MARTIAEGRLMDKACRRWSVKRHSGTLVQAGLRPGTVTHSLLDLVQAAKMVFQAAVS